jgi:hypothetical protein
MVYRRLADKLAACQGTKSVAAVAPRKRDANSHLGLLPCAQRLVCHFKFHVSIPFISFQISFQISLVDTPHCTE